VKNFKPHCIFWAFWGFSATQVQLGKRPGPTTAPDVRGDWTGTVFDPIYSIACNYGEQQAAMLYGNVWKKGIIARPEPWIGIRADPTFPQPALCDSLNRLSARRKPAVPHKKQEESDN
jgi:hypothetical protein